MTNLDIIKYLANNNPTRLADLLEDIYICAWIEGTNDKVGDESSIPSFDKWLYEDISQSNLYFRYKLEKWSKATNPTPTITTAYDNLTVTIPIKDSADHMWNNNNEYDYKENEI